MILDIQKHTFEKLLSLILFFILVATFDTFQLFEPRPVLESERQKRPV